MFRRHLLGILASAAAIALSPAPAHAGTFSISPLRVELSAGQATGVLTIRNRESAPVVVQAEVVLWEQADGEDRLTATRDVLVSPAVFTLPADGAQLVRVALRQPQAGPRELSYRLILTEIPQPASAAFTGLNVALRISLPVFVAPTSAPAPLLEWSAARNADGALTVTAHNTGNAHARVLTFSAAPVEGKSDALRQDVATYILPGQARSWTLDNNNNGTISSTEWNRLRLKGTTEAGDFEVETRLGDR
jgi:fimbrial chaperone protein